jgi:hypothetical protein
MQTGPANSSNSFMEQTQQQMMLLLQQLPHDHLAI